MMLEKTGAECLGPWTIGGSTRRLPGGRSLDLIAPDRSWMQKALATPARDAAGLPCVPLRYLVRMKRESGRLQDLADISRMPGGADAAGADKVRAAVVRCRPQATTDVESSLALGKREHGQSS